MILESFLPSFAANLAAMMIQSIGGQLGKKLSRPDNVKAIERCTKDAGMALIREVSHGPKKVVKARLNFLKTYFSHESVSRELSGLLNENEPDVEKLVLMFREDLGHDDSLFADWDIESGMKTLITTFLASALKEADLNRMIRANQLITQTHIQKALLEEIKKLVAFIRNGDHKITGIEAGVIKAQNVVSGTQINYTGALETGTSHKNQKLRERYLRKVKKDTRILPLEGIDPDEMTCKEGSHGLKLSSIWPSPSGSCIIGRLVIFGKKIAIY